MRDGCLILKGIVNDNMDVDTAKYLTGGLWDKRQDMLFIGDASK